LCDVPHLLPPLEEDEYVLDTPLVRDVVAEVRGRSSQSSIVGAAV
jgi:hypothetical protein